ncbi:hypothetical protein ACIRRA_25035 [Nocardia sp. NPDC101769]|uniref:hypothetical protein n=1 Tax=Nocardia sp. NPDC101769 TaxID=3364333 RepID=UPI00381ECC8D
MINTETLKHREVRAVVGLAEMRAMQLDVRGDYLALGRTQTYDLARKLLDADLIYPLIEVQAGAKWVVPKPRTSAWALGWRASDWRPSPMWAEHYRAVAQTRVALDACASHQWMSERIMRHEAPGRGPYPYDGRLMRPDWQCVAVKVDTTRYLTPEEFSHRLHAMRDQARRDQCAEVLYVCGGYVRPDTAVAIARRVLRYESDLDFVAMDLDSLIAKHRGPKRSGKGVVFPLRHRATGGAH